MRAPRKRRLAILIAIAVTGGALTVGGMTTASAADPLKVVLPGPGAPGSGTSVHLPDAMVGQPYSYQLQATGGVPPYTWTHREPDSNLPGMTLSPSGLISGTPPSFGETRRFGSGNLIVVTDSADPPTSVQQYMTFDVLPLPFRILNTSLPTGAVGQAYGVQLIAAGGDLPFKFSKGSPWPLGLKFTKSGAVYGVPKQGGQYTVTVNVTDAFTLTRIATRTFPLTITGAGSGTTVGGTKPVITATGDATCGGGVKMKVASVGSAPSYAISALMSGKLSCSGGTGNAAVRVVSANVSGAYLHSGGCSLQGVRDFSSGTSFGTFAVTWKSKGGKMSSTTVQFSNHLGSAAGWQLPAPSPPGTSTVMGSYAGVGTASAFVQGLVTTLEGFCDGAARKTKFVVPIVISF